MALQWKKCAEVCMVRKVNGIGCHNCIYRDTKCKKIINEYRVKSPYELLKKGLNHERFTEEK